ncbi:MAG: sulfotransferase [Chloroflexi bacterium]|nr:sulfotransferase [Chloroflexota bacterium]MBU1662718.1 sulfotransferase [Chloroflexota bacterium]
MINKITSRLKLTARVFLTGQILSNPRGEIPSITPEEVAEAREFFPLDKFFIFGHARSGTTLLTRLIRLHPDVHCNYQGHFFTRQPTLEGLVHSAEIEAWLTRRSNRWNRGRDLSPVVLRAAVDFIMEREARPLGARVVGDKSPNSLLNGEAVRLMHKVYPDGKLIFIVRDGRDAAVSHRFQTFIDATQHLTKEDWTIREAFERDPEPFLRGERSIFTGSGIRTAAEGWVRNVTETDELGRQIFGQQYISLRYEDLLSQPWEQMARLWHFLDVDTELPDLPETLRSELTSNPDRDWQRQKAGELVEPLQKGKSGSWRNLFARRDKAVFNEIAGDVLTHWGYGD